jgi:molecular chaperone HscB
MGQETNSERQCWRCREAAGDGLVCARCQAIQPLPAGVDLFAVLGLPRTPRIALEDLERRYHAASREVHPDRYQTAGSRERELSLAASAAVNRAYRTLRDPVALGRYWLELHGERLAGGDPQVPAALAAEVFDTQDRLEALRGAPGAAAGELRREIRELRERFAERLETLRAGLVAQYAEWNGADGAALAELGRRLAEIAYLGTLLADIDAAIGEEGRGADHRH